MTWGYDKNSERDDARKSPDALIGERFDMVVCNFGLSDIDDVDGACATVARVLVPDGVFAFSILHPCFPGVANVSGLA